MMAKDDDNPYAPPSSDLIGIDQFKEGSDLAWRDGDTLVVRKGAELPDRCIKCNAPAGGYRYRRTMEWFKPFWLLTLFCGVLVFAIIYLFVRWKGTVTVGLCELHRQRRIRAIALGWLLALAGIATFFIAGRASREVASYALVAGFALIIGGLVAAMIGTRVLLPVKMDQDYIWLARVSPEYLAELPWWNEPSKSGQAEWEF
jgi:hypothetical protein